MNTAAIDIEPTRSSSALFIDHSAATAGTAPAGPALVTRPDEAGWGSVLSAMQGLQQMSLDALLTVTAEDMPPIWVDFSVRRYYSVASLEELPSRPRGVTMYLQRVEAGTTPYPWVAWQPLEPLIGRLERLGVADTALPVDGTSVLDRIPAEYRTVEGLMRTTGASRALAGQVLEMLHVIELTRPATDPVIPPAIFGDIDDGTPTVLIIGPEGTGKSTAMRVLSDVPPTEVRATDPSGPQAGTAVRLNLEYGEASIGIYPTVRIYALPSDRRFNFMWAPLRHHAMAALLLVNGDAVDPIGDMIDYLHDYRSLAAGGRVAVGMLAGTGHGRADLSRFRTALAARLPELEVPVVGLAAHDRFHLGTLVASLLGRADAPTGPIPAQRSS